MSEILTSIKKLQDLRADVHTYVVVGGIDPRTLIKARTDLGTIVGPQGEIDVLLHSGGGSPDDAYRLISTFRRKYKIVNIVVPFWAKSAATLFAFGASRLVLHEFGELGPIDAQIREERDDDPAGGWASALNIQSSLVQIEKRSREGMVEMFTKMRANRDIQSQRNNRELIKIGRKQLADMLLDYSAKFYTPLLEKIDTIELGKMSRYLDIGRMYAARILNEYTDTEKELVVELLDFLVYECPDHGYVIDHRFLSRYLPHVTLGYKAPFNQPYYEELGRLSVTLMEFAGDQEHIGFINNLMNNIDDGSIPKESSEQTATAAGGAPDGGTSTGSGKDHGAKDISGNGQPTARKKHRVVP